MKETKNGAIRPLGFYTVDDDPKCHLFKGDVVSNDFEVIGHINDADSAKHIIKCVNSHQALVDALLDVMSKLDAVPDLTEAMDFHEVRGICMTLIATSRAALREAGEL